MTLGNCMTSAKSEFCASSTRSGTCALMLSIIGYQMPAASTWPEENAETTVAGSMATFSTSSMDIPASFRASWTIMFPEGTSGDMIVQLALKEAGMSIEDVEKAAMDPATAVSALASGHVAAAGVVDPLTENP